MLPSSFIVFVIWAYAGVDAVSVCPVKATSSHPIRHHGNWCYQFHLRETREFSAAQSECRSQGGNEVIVRDADTQQFLYHAIKGEFNYKGVVWLGLNDVLQEGIFRWVDGSPLTFSYWAQGEPGGLLGAIQDCAVMDMSAGGHWRDYRCEDFLVLRNPHPFVCEFPLKYITMPPDTTTTATTAETTVVTVTTTSQTGDVVTTTIPETTVPMTTVPQTTVQMITVPQTTIQMTTVPQTTVPMTTVPKTTVPMTTVPKTTVQMTTVPETTVPMTTVPKTTVQMTTVPETTVPMTTVPVTTVPITTVPKTTVPMTTVPKTTVPMTTVPVTTVPMTTVPVTTVPMTTVP